MIQIDLDLDKDIDVDIDDIDTHTQEFYSLSQINPNQVYSKHF